MEVTVISIDGCGGRAQSSVCGNIRLFSVEEFGWSHIGMLFGRPDVENMKPLGLLLPIGSQVACIPRENILLCQVVICSSSQLHHFGEGYRSG